MGMSVMPRTPFGMSVNRTAILDIPPEPNLDEPGAATEAAGRPGPIKEGPGPDDPPPAITATIRRENERRRP